MRNRVVVIGDCALIECNHKGQIIDCMVDVEDLEFLDSFGTDIGIIYNSNPGKYYGRMRANGTQVLLHRLLCNAKPGELVSFHDGNGLNCRRSNLYKADAVTISRANIVRTNKSIGGLIGVTPTYKRDGKYIARIIDDEGRKYLGCYDTLPQAIQARRQAEEDNWGM